MQIAENNSVPQGDGVAHYDATRHDTSRHTLTIKQAAELFVRYDVPRSPRSIQRFCDHGNIDCIRVKGEKTERYFVDPVSVERYAKELKQLENISHFGGEVTGYDAPIRDVARRDAPIEGPLPASERLNAEPVVETQKLVSRIDTIEKENLQLRIDRAAKEQVIGQLVDERRTWLTQLTEQSREIGRLEMQVQQLAAPRPDMTRHDTTDAVVDATIMAEPEALLVEVDAAPLPITKSTNMEPVKPSLWRRIFS